MKRKIETKIERNFYEDIYFRINYTIFDLGVSVNTSSCIFDYEKDAIAFSDKIKSIFDLNLDFGESVLDMDNNSKCVFLCEFYGSYKQNDDEFTLSYNNQVSRFTLADTGHIEAIEFRMNYILNN